MGEERSKPSSVSSRLSQTASFAAWGFVFLDGAVRSSFDANHPAAADELPVFRAWHDLAYTHLIDGSLLVIAHDVNKNIIDNKIIKKARTELYREMYRFY